MTPRQFRAWRKRLGLSQAKAAALLGKTRRTIQSYDHGLYPDGRKCEIPKSIYLATLALEYLPDRPS